MVRRITGRKSVPSIISNRWPCLVPLAVALSLTVSLGCGSSSRSGTAHVQGTVTIGGQPLPADAQASLTISPISKGRTAGAVITNGRYDCADAPVGKVKVFFNVMQKTGKMITEADNRPYAEVGSIISPKYSSGVEAEITGDNTNQDFDLEPAPK